MANITQLYKTPPHGDGEMDEYPENAFFNVGTIEDVKKKAEMLTAQQA